MKKRYILFIISILIITFAIYVVFSLNKNKQSKSEENISKQTESLKDSGLLEEKIENIREELGHNNTNTEMYEISTEYDGREVVVVKPNMQYKVAMAGVIKNGKPEFSEIENLLKEAPNKNGIWIEKNSREAFLNILKEVTVGEYSIDSEGYLIQKQSENLNEIDGKIKNAINSKKLYAICIHSIAYLIDEVTGNIEPYPFEEIDPGSPFEYFETENAALYVVTPNTYKKLDARSIIEGIFK